jgi:peptidoglycan/xylan/chitin deacetylase (PgdA/CDA1 family)
MGKSDWDKKPKIKHSFKLPKFGGTKKPERNFRLKMPRFGGVKRPEVKIPIAKSKNKSRILTIFAIYAVIIVSVISAVTFYQSKHIPKGTGSEESVVKVIPKKVDESSQSQSQSQVVSSKKSQASSSKSQSLSQLAITSKVVYLTFDDGPSKITPQILKILKENNVKGSFFVTYNEDPEIQEYYKQIIDAGHELGVHSYSHIYKNIYQNPTTYMADLNKMRDFIITKTGVIPVSFRFPGGSSANLTSIANINEIIKKTKALGMNYQDWNVSSGYERENLKLAKEIYQDVLTSGLLLEEPVVLFNDYDTNVTTLEALPRIINVFKDNGYRFDTIKNVKNPVQHYKPRK